jgi:hypothetical protein
MPLDQNINFLEGEERPPISRKERTPPPPAALSDRPDADSHGRSTAL